MNHRKPLNYFFPTMLLLGLITGVVFTSAVWDSSAQIRALDTLTPLLVPLAGIFKDISGYGHPWFLYLALVVIGALGLVSLKLESRASRSLCYSAMLAVAGQLFLVDRELCFSISQLLGLSQPGASLQYSQDDFPIALPAGIGFYLAALGVFFFGRGRSAGQNILDVGTHEARLFGIREAVLLTVVFIVALIFRTYALNVLPDSFEGELSPFSAGATSFKGMFVANRGAYGPWAPLGILYYLPIYLMTKAFGVTILALRLSSDLVGLFTLPLVYLLAARLGGRVAGLFASALFALECLNIGWSRTDIHPHGVTTWPTLLMCWFLLRAFDTRKLSWACGVAFMMGLSWHQYPSGQSAVAIPLIAIGLFWLANRWKFPLAGSQTAIVASGVVLWIVGLPLSYFLGDGQFYFSNPFTLTGPRAAWGEDSVPTSPIDIALTVISKASSQLGDVLQGLFYRQPYLFHQEWISYADFVNGRTVAWLEVPFVVLGLLLLLRSFRRFESSVMAAWILAAILPGILSEHAYPKRLSTLFAALDIVAAISLASIVATLPKDRALWKRVVTFSSLVIVFAAYFAYTSYAWFSGQYWRFGEPKEISLAAKLGEVITPGTIVISDLNRSYEAGKYLYLSLDHLADPKNRPNLWFGATTPLVPQLVANPLSAVQLAPTSLAYTWTKLREQLDETMNVTNWSKVVFIVQAGPEDQAVNLSNQELALTRCHNPRITRLARENRALDTLVLVECNIADLK